MNKNINKIMCCCIAGLGSSFIVEMNVKKALNRLNLNDIQVEHAGLSDAVKGAADLFVCSSDIEENCLKAGDTIPINHLADAEEIYEKLKNYFEQS